MKHFTSPAFWECYAQLPNPIQESADRNYEILKENPHHPSLHLKKIGQFWSVRISLKYRALGVEIEDGVLWFWIGTHAEYDDLIK
jgi:hypothetical protein